MRARFALVVSQGPLAMAAEHGYSRADPMTGRQLVPMDEAKVHHVLLERLLAARGIDFDSAESYLSPSLDQMHDPEQLPGALQASSLLVEALKAEKTIAIYGDYDVDGVTSAAFLTKAKKVQLSTGRLGLLIVQSSGKQKVKDGQK